MTDAQAVRAALEKIQRRYDALTAYTESEAITRVFTAEGLAACDEYEADTLQGKRLPETEVEAKLDIFASILCRSGLL